MQITIVIIIIVIIIPLSNNFLSSGFSFSTLKISSKRLFSTMAETQELVKQITNNLKYKIAKQRKANFEEALGIKRCKQD